MQMAINTGESEEMSSITDDPITAKLIAVNLDAINLLLTTVEPETDWQMALVAIDPKDKKNFKIVTDCDIRLLLEALTIACSGAPEVMARNIDGEQVDPFERFAATPPKDMGN